MTTEATTTETTTAEESAPRRAERPIKYTCDVQLSGEERLAKGLELTKALAEYDELDILRAETAKDFRDRLGGIDQRIKTLRGEFESGRERREADCVEERDYDRQVIVVRRGRKKGGG